MTKPLTAEEVNAILRLEWGTVYLADGTVIGEALLKFEGAIPTDDLLIAPEWPFKIDGVLKFPPIEHD